MQNKKDNKISEPIADYGKPLTFDHVWKMFQETDKQFKETDKKLIGCLAGMVVPDKIKEIAEQAGLLVLVQSNNDFDVINTKEFKPSIF